MVGWWLYVAEIHSPQRSVSAVWRSSLCAGMGCFSYMNAFIHVLCTMLLCSSFKFMMVRQVPVCRHVRFLC